MAIQVAGTNIITDAKALNGITSIDSTTASAFSAGGVGGLTTLISSGSIGTVSTLSFSFTDDYSFYKIKLLGACFNTSATSYGVLRARLTDSTGTTITSNYNGGGRAHLSSSNTTFTDHLNVQYGYGTGQSINGARWTVDMDIHSPYNQYVGTHMRCHVWQGDSDGGTDGNFQQTAMGSIHEAERHNSIFFYWSNNENFQFGTYEFYGVN